MPARPIPPGAMVSSVFEQRRHYGTAPAFARWWPDTGALRTYPADSPYGRPLFLFCGPWFKPEEVARELALVGADPAALTWAPEAERPAPAPPPPPEPAPLLAGSWAAPAPHAPARVLALSRLLRGRG